MLRLRDTGSLLPRAEGRGPQRDDRTLEAEEQILDCIQENPARSTRSIARHVGVSHTVVHRTLKEERLRPYHIQRVQALEEQDCPPRREFSEWFLLQSAHHDFVNKILVTDEACFTRDGVTNFHNMHTWSVLNPRQVVATHSQRRFSVNVWAGILDDYIIGPYVLPARLTGSYYRTFLEEILLPTLLEDIPLGIRHNMWFLHDGAPPHIGRRVRRFLDIRFPGRWIGRSGPRRWPARSPDLNPLDFYFWGHMKELVYAQQVNNVDELTQRIFDAANTIRENVHVCERVRRNWVRRNEACVEVNGGHFEHLL